MLASYNSIGFPFASRIDKTPTAYSPCSFSSIGTVTSSPLIYVSHKIGSSGYSRRSRSNVRRYSASDEINVTPIPVPSLLGFITMGNGKGEASLNWFHVSFVTQKKFGVGIFKKFAMSLVCILSKQSEQP